MDMIEWGWFWETEHQSARLQLVGLDQWTVLLVQSVNISAQILLISLNLATSETQILQIPISQDFRQTDGKTNKPANNQSNKQTERQTERQCQIFFNVHYYCHQNCSTKDLNTNQQILLI